MKHIQSILDAIESKCYSARIAYQSYRHNRFKQHWQAASFDGASIQLGHMTRAKAIGIVAKFRDGSVTYIDDERGVIVFGSPPSSAE